MVYPHVMKPAFLKDEKFLADVRAAPAARGIFHLWWLGQSGFLVQHDGRFLLMDPYLSDSLTRKYAGTGTPHVRMSERVVDPACLGFVSVITCSHAHTDHMDGETIRPILAANPEVQLVIPEAARELAAERLGIESSRPIGLNDGAQRAAAGFTISGIPSAHDAVETDEAGNHRYLGYVLEAGGRRFYHSGDTRPYDGLAERLARFNLDLGLLPINGWAPERRVKGNLDIHEAVGLGLASGMRLVVPHHFDMFEFNTGDPETFGAAARQRGLPVKILRLGERLTLDGSSFQAAPD
jgi:L-ascorbate metabolism protein UlaG (beta-lactamase superfamily)